MSFLQLRSPRIGNPLTNPPTVAGSTGEIKVWSGASWVAKPVKVWNGSAWVVKPLKRWNGTSWVTTSY